jgi:hypothetical protein
MFVACIGVATTYMYDDRWLLLGFLIVTIYVHVFCLCQLPNVWTGLCNTSGAVPYTFQTAVAVSLGITSFIVFVICVLFNWFRFLPYVLTLPPPSFFLFSVSIVCVLCCAALRAQWRVRLWCTAFLIRT